VVQRPAKQRSGRSGGAQIAHVTRRTLEESALYSEELGINLAKCNDAACFRWFLASLLFGARISETIAKNTYRSFVRQGLTSPRRIVEAGWTSFFPSCARVVMSATMVGSRRKSCATGGSLRRLHDEACDG
jgi:hypothetical protein